MNTNSGSTAGAPGDLAARAAERMLGPNPFVGLRGGDVLAGAGQVVGKAMTSPALLLEQEAKLARELIEVLVGNVRLAPERRDKRFLIPRGRRTRSTAWPCRPRAGARLWRNRAVDPTRGAGEGPGALRGLAHRPTRWRRRTSCSAIQRAGSARNPRPEPAQGARHIVEDLFQQRRHAVAGRQDAVHGRRQLANTGRGGVSATECSN